jgi:hypothetical protein
MGSDLFTVHRAGHPEIPASGLYFRVPENYHT